MNIMIITSLLAGFLSTMNVYAVKYEDMRLHLNDVYMVTLMTSLMILFHFIAPNNTMHNMSNSVQYQNIMLAAFVSIIIFLCIRNQFLINDSNFLNGMIPHHSMALLMSKNIIKKTKNEKIRKLAQSIIDSQTQEINEMNNILSEIE